MHTGDLHILVKSLSQTEKTYFRKAARFQKLDSHYMRLYRAIENRDAYDDMYIGELFKGEAFLKQLAVAKNYLYHTILKNLIPYSAASNTKGRIDRLLAEAHVLFEKRLYSQARDITLICKKISLKHELFTELLSALELEFNIRAAEQVYDYESDRLMENIYKARKDIIKKIGNLYKYDLLQHKFISLLHRYMGSQDRKFVKTIDRMINNSILRDENTALSTIAQMKFNHIHSIYHYVKGNLPESHVFLSREIELLTGKKELMNERIHILLILLANRLSILLGLKKYRDFPAELDSFKKYLRYPQVKKSPVLRFYVIDFSYMLEIFYMCKTGNFENAIKLASEFTAKLNENKFELSKSDNIEFLNLKAQAYFGCGRFKDALEHINLILNDKEAEENYRNYPLAKIFNLIIHFELQNYDLLEYMVPATYKYLVKRKNLFKYEKLIIDFLRKTPSVSEYKELLENFKILKENVNSISSDRFEKNALEYFDIISWIESKIEGEPLASVVRSKTAA